MRFLHAADIHLDSPLAAVARRAGDSADIFVGAARRALSKMVDFALAERVDFVLLAGDLWDGDWKDAHAGLFFVRETARLAAANIPVVAVAGNHDAASAVSGALVWPDNVRFLNPRKPETLRLLNGAAAVHGQGFGKQAVSDNLVLRYPPRTPGAFNIGLLHTALDGAEGHAPYAPCSVDDLRGKGYDYWALGHVHAARIVARDPWIVYPGNLQGRHIRETGAKGCVLVTVADNAVVSVESVACDAARWAAVTVDVGGLERWESVIAALRDGLAEAALAADGRPLAARATLTGATALDAALRARPQRLEADALAAAEQLTAADVWIERVKIATTPLRALAEPGADSLTAVVDIAARLGAEDGEERAALAQALAEARRGWPDWLKDAATADDDDIAVGAPAVLADRLGMNRSGADGQGGDDAA
jgi:DNA repair protein SbcD/Mre11